MAIFYMIHHFIHNILNLDKTDGQKNCFTFLLGTIAWVLLWVALYTLKDTFYYEALRTGFIVILIADFATMAYLYKSYYGRFITNEIGEDPSTTEWKFDDKTKKYKKKDAYDQRIDDYESKKRFNNYLEKLEEENKKINTEKQRETIIQQKNMIRSTIKLQNWWRERLYQPSTGIFYKKAEENFISNTSDPSNSTDHQEPN